MARYSNFLRSICVHHARVGLWMRTKIHNIRNKSWSLVTYLFDSGLSPTRRRFEAPLPFTMMASVCTNICKQRHVKHCEEEVSQGRQNRRQEMIKVFTKVRNIGYYSELSHSVNSCKLSQRINTVMCSGRTLPSVSFVQSSWCVSICAPTSFSGVELPFLFPVRP